MKKEMNEEIAEGLPHEEGIEFYGDPAIASYHGKIPLFLLLTYFILPIWGIAVGYYYWNGSVGWLDRGYWHQLQIAANTTLPYENQNLLTEEATHRIEAPS